MRLSRKQRRRHYDPIPKAGERAGWSRSESYRRARDGTIPVEKDGKYFWVPRKLWAAKLKRLLRGPRECRDAASAAAENNTA
jgi:hypothetical protein